jgi:hypothetical protein
MPDYDFKPGDRVMFRDWDDMIAEFGVHKYSAAQYIRTPHYAFINEMRHLCGTYATIAYMDNNQVFLANFSVGSDHKYTFTIYMLRPVMSSVSPDTFYDSILE